MKVTILTAREQLYNAEAKEVVLPGEDGEFALLDFHQGCLYSLRAGQIKVREKMGPIVEEKRFAIKSGIAKMGENRLAIMVEEINR